MSKQMQSKKNLSYATLKCVSGVIINPVFILSF